MFILKLWIWLLAVREDRTPGGKHRIKKLRLDDGDASGFGLPIDASSALECASSEEDELLIQQLVDARPDMLPGPLGNFFPCCELNSISYVYDDPKKSCLSQIRFQKLTLVFKSESFLEVSFWSWTLHPSPLKCKLVSAKTLFICSVIN